MTMPCRPHLHKKHDEETNAQRKRRNMMRLVHQVVEVGEQHKAHVICRRLCLRYPNGHHAMPSSANQLGQVMRGEKSMMKIEVGTKQYEWRRIE